MSRPVGSKNKPKSTASVTKGGSGGVGGSGGFILIPKGVNMASVSNYDPHHNPKAISLQQQEDGNWYGEINKNGVVKSCRQISPEVVLQYLMYHEGEIV